MAEDFSPAEWMLLQANPAFFDNDYPHADEGEIVHFPWEPTGDETPKKTVELEESSKTPYTVPVAETAGGSIPSGFAQFRKYGPDES